MAPFGHAAAGCEEPLRPGIAVQVALEQACKGLHPRLDKCQEKLTSCFQVLLRLLLFLGLTLDPGSFCIGSLLRLLFRSPFEPSSERFVRHTGLLRLDESNSR